MKRAKTEKNLLDHRRTKNSYFGRVKKPRSTYGTILREEIDAEAIQFFAQFTPSPKRRPLIVLDQNTAYTPQGKTHMKAQTKIGPFICYSADLDHTPQKTNTQLALNATHSETIKNQLAPINPKSMSESFNLNDIEKVRTQKKEQGNRRKKPQGKVISANSRIASATKIARKYGITKSRHQRFEWTHLIAYRFLGEAGQIPENLILATKECNSLMMIFEEAVLHLCEKLHKSSKVCLEVSADTIPGTHIGTCIHYRIVALDLDFDLKVTFDPRMTAVPTRNLESEVHKLFKYALKKKGPVCFDTPSPQKQPFSRIDDSDKENRAEPMTLNF